MKAYKNRKIDPKKPVKVYRNLHNKSYSIQQDGLVVGHTDELYLKECDFIVRKAGQRRVRLERKKNVHAFVVGYLDRKHPLWRNYGHLNVTYNPYVMDEFMATSNGTDYYPITSAKKVQITKNEVHAFFPTIKNMTLGKSGDK